jgi:hypothetical protein
MSEPSKDHLIGRCVGVVSVGAGREVREKILGRPLSPLPRNWATLGGFSGCVLCYSCDTDHLVCFRRTLVPFFADDGTVNEALSLPE